jgi:hypothetical protein
MKTNHQHWAVKAAGLCLFAITAAAQSGDVVYSDPTNRVTLTLQFALNLRADFRGIGGNLNSLTGNGRVTPNGNAYNYDNGYVLTDISGNAGGQSWYWGYDNANQVNTANHTIAFDRATWASASATSTASDGNPAVSPGFEVDYNRLVFAKEDWHNIRFGLDSAVSYVPITINNNSVDGLAKQIDTYSYSPGTTPPGYNAPSELPYQGSYQGPGFLINVPPSSTAIAPYPNATVASQDNFDANLFGLHLGPYVEIPFGKQEQFTFSLAGGLAVGLLQADESWYQAVSIPGNNKTAVYGSGSDFTVLWGWYAGANAAYQFSEHWSVSAGAQFQDLGNYDHGFRGRQVNLDLSRSVLILAGLSYNF